MARHQYLKSSICRLSVWERQARRECVFRTPLSPYICIEVKCLGPLVAGGAFPGSCTAVHPLPQTIPL